MLGWPLIKQAALRLIWKQFRFFMVKRQFRIFIMLILEIDKLVKVVWHRIFPYSFFKKVVDIKNYRVDRIICPDPASAAAVFWTGGRAIILIFKVYWYNFPP